MGSGPVFVPWCFCAFCFAFSAGETQVWLGDLRVVALVWLLVLCFASIDLLISRTVRPCTDVFAAYSHVRTEPLARHRPNSRKKMLHVFICKEKSSHFRYPLARTIHIDCYLGKGPRVGLKNLQAHSKLIPLFQRSNETTKNNENMSLERAWKISKLTPKSLLDVIFQKKQKKGRISLENLQNLSKLKKICVHNF